LRRDGFSDDLKTEILYATNTFLKQKELTLPHSFSSIKKLLPLPNSSKWLMLGDSTVLKFVEGPEMDVTGNSISIADGDSTPYINDHTEFGSSAVGTSASNTYTVINTGLDILHLSGITLNGAGCAEFSITAQPETSVAAGGGSTAFTLSYSPADAGEDICAVTVVNDDSDENPYNFFVKGIGTEKEENKSWPAAVYQLLLTH
jgi:hypothetical protein